MAVYSSKDKELRDKLSSGEFTFASVSGKSDVWQNFKLIVKTNTQASIGYVQCQKCLNFFSYNSKSGTSHLRRHKCEKISSSKLTNFIKSAQTSAIDKSDKQTVLQATVKMCAKDLRPFDIVSGEGFINFAQVLINIGAKRGTINISDVLPHPTTVSRNTIEVAETLRSKLIPCLNDKIKEGLCAASTDMWTDDYKKKSYTAVTVHYFDDDWNLNSNLLFTCVFPEESKTGINIRKEITNRFAKLGLSGDAMQKMVFVTDRGSNIINALQPFKRLDCMAHAINTVLRNLFSNDYLKEKNFKVFDTLTATKSLVTYLKQSGLVNRLNKSVHQDSETRWNSKLRMFESVHENYTEISELLTEKKEENRLDDIDVNILLGLIQFLIPFKEASLELEKEKEITLPFVLLWYTKLLTLCEVNTEDDDFIKDLKSRCSILLKNKFILRDEHKIATFLCPSFRQLRMLDETEKEHTINLVQKTLEEMQNKNDCVATSTSTCITEKTPKKCKIESKFMEWADEEVHDSDKTEMEIYCSLKSPTAKETLNSWWKNNQSKLPIMSKIAKKVLCVPATSASCERNFSSAGFLMNERRTRLDPDVIDASLFLHDNL